MHYIEAREFVDKAQEYASAMGIEAVGKLLQRLGAPQEELKIIHVGGTNGKGSVASYITYMLVAAGYRVGRYVSPTIREYRERLQVVSLKEKPVVEYIGEEQFARLANQCQRVYGDMEKQGCGLPSTFELETAIGFLYFKEMDCDVVVLEVGLGGRTDATNCISKSLCSVLCSISMDHMSILGDTLAEIAAEKAGIVKEQGKVIAYDYKSWSKECGCEDMITPVILQKCKEMNAFVSFVDFSKITKEEHSMAGITFTYGKHKELFTTLLGKHQVKNAALALEVVDYLRENGYEISEKNIIQGMKWVKWEGRFQIIREKPYYILDGAHNGDAARNLANTIKKYLPGKRILAVVGILADKEYEQVLAYTAPLAEKILTITPDNPRALSASELAGVAKTYCEQVEVAETMERAIMLAEREEKEFDAVLIFGSLYSLHLAYEILEK